MIKEAYFLQEFRDFYPEFANVSDELIYKTYKKIYCLYTLIQNPYINGNSGDVDCKKEQMTFMIVAHYLAYNGALNDGGVSSGANSSSGGVLASASVDGVSVSFQSQPISDFYQSFFSSSSYGREFLAYLALLGNATYIN